MDEYRGSKTVSGLLAVVLGIVGIGVLYKTMPLWDIMNMFFLIVCIPLMGAAALGLVSWGFVNVIRANTVGAVARIRNHLEAEMQAKYAAAGAPLDAQHFGQVKP